MTAGSLAAYLAELDEATLTGLLQARPDALAEPVPRGFEQLAQRLTGPQSLAAALWTLDRDALTVGRMLAALGASDLPGAASGSGSAATPAAVARLLDGTEPAVAQALDELYRRGLAWPVSATVGLPERLAGHWANEIGGGRPVALIARSVPVDDVRVAAAALGVEVTGLRKPELVSRLAEAMSDLRSLAEVVRGLAPPARTYLDELFDPYAMGYFQPGGQRIALTLAEAGLMLRAGQRWEVPREVLTAAWLVRHAPTVTGRPVIPKAEVTASDPTTRASTTRSGSAQQAAVQELLRAVMAVLDEAEANAIAALAKGGVGVRVRARLATRLALPADVLTLVIDLTYALGLLGRSAAGYAPTEQYSRWREASPATQWAPLATVWFGLEYAPTSRDREEGDKELPPPLAPASTAGALRRTLLRTATDGRSVRAVGEQADWFCPLHGYPPGLLRDKIAAILAEAELLGVVAGDALTECGEALVRAAALAEPAEELAERVAGALVDTPGTVILQSDLTAVVSGRPTVAAARLLGAAAETETRGAAAVWRFSPASVRAALDAGWTADRLVAELAALSDRALPQPLEYLVNDVARRHGQVRVRGMRSCVVADEALATEILHTRSLAKLQLAQVAPTVLSSPFELDDVLTKLRAAGLSPVAEDSGGTVIVEARPEHRAASSGPAPRTAPRSRLSAAELATRLRADPSGVRGTAGAEHLLNTFNQLARLNPALDDAELTLLADALDQQRDVRITYRTKTGGRTVRDIQPRKLYGHWIESWCHLRDAQREFTVANIETVSPAG
jgi:hypothetical protein